MTNLKYSFIIRRHKVENINNSAFLIWDQPFIHIKSKSVHLSIPYRTYLKGAFLVKIEISYFKVNTIFKKAFLIIN